MPSHHSVLIPPLIWDLCLPIWRQVIMEALIHFAAKLWSALFKQLVAPVQPWLNIRSVVSMECRISHLILKVPRTQRQVDSRVLWSKGMERPILRLSQNPLVKINKTPLKQPLSNWMTKLILNSQRKWRLRNPNKPLLKDKIFIIITFHLTKWTCWSKQLTRQISPGKLIFASFKSTIICTMPIAATKP